jgi:DNA-binding transcriptional ArsR family regulator
MMVQIRKIKEELKNEKLIKECAERFGLLWDLTKMKICYLSCYYPELSVSEIAEILKMPISRVSHALRKLKEKGVVSSWKDWRYCFYKLKDQKLSKLIKTYL